jgi:hypothetical protein
MATVERVHEALTEQHLGAGGTDVRRLHVRLGDDANGDPAFLVRLVLSDPPAGEETWPVSDLRALRRTIRDKLGDIDPELRTPWIISFEPESSEQFAPEDTEGEVQVDQ